jgi:hypothetical protein
MAFTIFLLFWWFFMLFSFQCYRIQNHYKAASESAEPQTLFTNSLQPNNKTNSSSFNEQQKWENFSRWAINSDRL